MSAEYDLYLKKHITLVKELHKLLWDEELAEHDSSKLEEPEYSAYDKHWHAQAENKLEEFMWDREYNYAWAHHIRKNGHHHSHWVVLGDDGDVTILDIPKKYLKEMLADWSSFYINNPEGLIEWYAGKREHMKLSYLTRSRVDRLLPYCVEMLTEHQEELKAIEEKYTAPKRNEE